MATDVVIERDGRLAELSPLTMKRLDAVLPSTWSKGNPVDIVSDASAQRYALGEGRQWLSESETRAVLSGCSIATGACLTFTTRRFTTNREHPIQICHSRGLSVIMPSVQVHRPRQTADSRDSGRRRNGKGLDRGR
jgi:acyl-CoA synthetase (NDP forming)